MNLMAPFDAVAAWAMAAIPARLRGVVPVEFDRLAVSRAKRVQVRLPEAALLIHRIDLPAGPVPEARLAALITAKCDEVSPWEAGEYLADWVPQGAGLVLALTQMKPLREARVVEVVGVAQGLRFQFRHDERQQRAWRGRLALAFALLVGLGLGAAGFGGMMTLQAQDRLSMAEGALARQKAKQAAVTGLSRDAAALIARKSPEQSLAVQLDHLAARLPNDSWLESLSIGPAGFELAGRSTNPEGIIPALEADPAFSQVDFAGSSAHDADTGQFTFSVQGKIAP